MIKDYLGSRNPPQEKKSADAGGSGARTLRELQRQWSKVLARCYELHEDGGRCHYAGDVDRRFNCTVCDRRDEDAFCQANVFLKRVVKLVAAYLAEKNSGSDAARLQAPSAPSDADSDGTPPPPLTQEQIDAFKAVGLSVEIETSLRDEHVWLVPQRTNADRLELTPEEINFLVQTTAAFEGQLVAIARDTDEDTDEHTHDNPDENTTNTKKKEE